MAGNVIAGVSASPTGTGTIGGIDPTTARTTLAELQRTLRDESGRPRTGLLRLKRSTEGESLRFERQTSFHLKRVGRAQVQDTAQALRRLFAAAGLSARALGELDRYLRNNDERAQAAQIADLLDQHLPREDTAGVATRPTTVLDRESSS